MLAADDVPVPLECGVALERADVTIGTLRNSHQPCDLFAGAGFNPISPAGAVASDTLGAGHRLLEDGGVHVTKRQFSARSLTDGAQRNEEHDENLSDHGFSSSDQSAVLIEPDDVE